MQIAINEATAAKRRIAFQCLADIDGVSPMLGLTFGTVTDLKVGKGFTEANFAGTATEIAAGFYFYQFAAAEVNTLGPLTLRLNITGVRPQMYQHQVV